MARRQRDRAGSSALLSTPLRSLAVLGNIRSVGGKRYAATTQSLCNEVTRTLILFSVYGTSIDGANIKWK